jgi:hypothetical protein
MVPCQLVKKIIVLIHFSVILMNGYSAFAESAIQCHCFQEREFSSDHPQAFDPYLLATIQNRFMASYFGVSRKQIVKLKMTGVDNDKLWIAYELSQKSLQPVVETLAVIQKLQSWQSVLHELSLDPETLNAQLLTAMLGEGTDRSVAWFVVRKALLDKLAVDSELIGWLYERNATFQEIVLTAVLSSSSHMSIPEIVDRQEKLASWGRLLADQKLTLLQLEQSFAN